MGKIKIGIVGFGNVGSDVAEILFKQKKNIAARIGSEINIAAVCDINSSKIPASLKKVYIENWCKVVQDPDIDLIVELVGGYEPARSIIIDSLDSGKNVVTANKAVIAKHWDEILSKAISEKKLVYFEAAVGGGIPIIQVLNEGLAANKISKIYGILNGTTNFILTKMHKHGLSFSSALKSAQKEGFAESEPSFDIKGIDSANKMAILASIASAAWIKVEDIFVEGIERISPLDINYIQKELKYTVKLIGKAIFENNCVDISVRPTLVSDSHPFKNVDGIYNAVLIHGDSVGDIMLYGRGAGGLPAASAVVSDIIFLARQIIGGTAGIMPYIGYEPKKRPQIVGPEKRKGYYYLRFEVADRPGVLAKITAVLARNNVSIAAVYQNVPPEQLRKGAKISILTHETNEGKLIKSLSVIDELREVNGKSVFFPVER